METRRLWLMWWAGLLALATFGHLLRLLLGWSVVVNGFAVPMWASGVIAPVAGAGSLWLVRRARGVG